MQSSGFRYEVVCSGTHFLLFSPSIAFKMLRHDTGRTAAKKKKILGEHWLESVSPIWVDYRHKKMKITYQGHRITLYGIQDTVSPRQQLSRKKVKGLLRSGMVCSVVPKLSQPSKASFFFWAWVPCNPVFFCIFCTLPNMKMEKKNR
jgi:hypothetical protein